MTRLLFFLTLLIVSAACEGQPALSLQQTMIEGLSARGIDLKDPRVVFATVFARLPGEVMVYPTENYFYWTLFCDGREIRGNIRLPSGQREKGMLCVGYAGYVEFPGADGAAPEISEAKYFGRDDGVIITCADAFTSLVEFAGKKVIFHFNQLPQLPPAKFPLPAGEVFVERTCDESGFPFFLLYNTEKKYFFWVLNEEGQVPDHFEKLGDDIVTGRRSGFVFWIDRNHKDRKILAAVRQLSVRRNDYFDGPFDQLADNYAEQANVKKYIEEAIPSYHGRIDKYGYITDAGEPKRVALNNYGTYETLTEAAKFIARAKKSGDVRQFISRAGGN